MTYRWLVVALTMLMQAFAYGILFYSFGLFVVPWLDTFETARAQIMLAVFVMQISMGVLSPFAGRLLDHYPTQWLVTLGGAMMATGLILVSHATSWWQIIILYTTILPATLTLIGPLAAQTIVAKWFTAQRGLAIGTSAVGTSIGGFFVPMLTGALLEVHGWRVTTQYLAYVVLVVLCPTAWLILRRKPPALENTAPATSNRATDAPDINERPEQRLWTTREILTTRNFWIPAIALLPLSLAFSGIQFNLAAYAQDLGNSLRDAAWLISLMSLSMIVGKLFFGYLSDRIDHRILYGIAAGFMVLALVLIQGGPGYFILCVSSILTGLFTGGLLPMMGTIYGHRFGARSFGRVMGLVYAVITLGGIGPLLAGAVYDATGSYDAAFITFLVVLIPAALGMIWLKPQSRN